MHAKLGYHVSHALGLGSLCAQSTKPLSFAHLCILPPLYSLPLHTGGCRSRNATGQGQEARQSDKVTGHSENL